MESNLDPEHRGKIGYYLLYNENTDQAYAGSGVLDKRQVSHDYLLRNNKHFNPKLQAAYNADPNFKFIGVPLDEGNPELTRKAALLCEQETIDEHWGNPLFLNIVKNVEQPRLGIPHSSDVIEKIGQRLSEQWQDPEWAAKVVQAQNAGKAAMSEEDITRRNQRLSESIKAAYENGVRISNAGQIRSEEFCKNDSDQITQLWQDPEYRAKQCVAKIGNRNAPMKEVVVNGVKYESKSAAAKTFGITKQTVSHRLSSKNFPEWKEVD